MKKIICILLVLLMVSGCGASEKETLYDKYEDIIVALENNNFDVAIGSINGMKIQKMKEEAGDINDYLVEVDINENNFDDYFELVVFSDTNAFGEETNDTRFGYKSKAYDDGLIIYKMDDGMVVEMLEQEFTMSEDLDSLLMFGRTWSNTPIDELSIERTGRIVGGKISFIKAEYISKYEIGEQSNPGEQVVEFNIELLNGETIIRYGNTIYPY